MKTQWLSRTILALVLVAAVTACDSDARFKKVTVGMGKDSVAILSGGAVSHHTSQYLTGGKLWVVEFYAKPTVQPADSVEWRKMTPVVFIENKVVGVGWSYLDKEGAELRLGLPPKK